MISSLLSFCILNFFNFLHFASVSNGLDLFGSPDSPAHFALLHLIVENPQPVSILKLRIKDKSTADWMETNSLTYNFVCFISSVSFSFFFVIWQSSVCAHAHLYRLLAPWKTLCTMVEIQKCKECGFISICHLPSEVIGYSLELFQAIFQNLSPRGKWYLRLWTQKLKYVFRPCLYYVIILTVGKLQISVCLPSVKWRLKIAHIWYGYHKD